MTALTRFRPGKVTSPEIGMSRFPDQRSSSSTSPAQSDWDLSPPFTPGGPTARQFNPTHRVDQIPIRFDDTFPGLIMETLPDTLLPLNLRCR